MWHEALGKLDTALSNLISCGSQPSSEQGLDLQSSLTTLIILWFSEKFSLGHMVEE